MTDLSVPTKDQLLEVIEHLRPDQLAQVWEYVTQLAEQPTAPIYQIHEKAAATGVKDLAQQHDHYLYGQDKHDV
jgi:hypothetical protein